jgi:hypothetical protein
MSYPKRMGKTLHEASLTRDAYVPTPKSHDARSRSDVVRQDLADLDAGRRRFSRAYSSWLDRQREAVS